MDNLEILLYSTEEVFNENINDRRKKWIKDIK